MKMSPLTAVLKCPHYEKGYFNNESEREAEVRQLLDGSWRVYYKDKLIAQTDPTPLKEPIRAKPRRKSNVRAACQERWVYMASAA
jgi:hypothetical protein